MPTLDVGVRSANTSHQPSLERRVPDSAPPAPSRRAVACHPHPTLRSASPDPALHRAEAGQRWCAARAGRAAARCFYLRTIAPSPEVQLRALAALPGVTS
jgi:hypothetical protein